VPDLRRFDRGQRVYATTVDLDGVELDCSVHDPVAQRVTTQHVTVGSRGIHCHPIEIRYAWPAELDLMAPWPGLSPRRVGVAGTADASAPTAGRTYPSGGHRQNIRPIAFRVRVPVRRDSWLASH
jgi:hypothetical protein